MRKISLRNVCPTSCRWLVVALVLLLAGCGKSKGKVSGTVSLDGNKLTMGTVAFFATDNTVKQGQIQSDGTYSIDGVPAGPAKITVTVVDPGKIPTREMDPSKMGGKGSGKKAGSEEPASRPEAVPVPSRFGHPEKSGLTFDVKADEDNKYDIPLTSGKGGEKAE